jgi:2-polyprenyl-3-methyl-5-hydroxy-6-metoxy-1,4-benzoquinol methylase
VFHYYGIIQEALRKFDSSGLDINMDGLNESIECEIERRTRKTAEAMPWRPNQEKWVQRRIWQEHYQEPVLDNRKSYVAEWKQASILDLGSGRGGLVVRLRQEGVPAMGIDYCFDYCVISKLRGTRYGIDTPVVNGQGEFLPFKNRSVDVVFCYHVIEHVFDPDALIRELRRIILPGGRVFISLPNRWTPYDTHYRLWGINYLPRSLANKIIHLFGRDKGNDVSAGYQKLEDMHYFSYYSFKKLCRNHDFAPYDIREDKLVNGKLDGLSSSTRLFISALRKCKLLMPIYRFWRCTLTEGWHFSLIAESTD